MTMTTNLTRFKLGLEGTLDPDHIGALVTIDARKKTSRGQWRDLCWHGRIQSFVEDRGVFEIEAVDGEPLDHVGEEQYSVSIGFVGGRTVEIGDQDYAIITIHKEVQK